jgi:hypothetical protein
MPQGARVESLQALQALKVALIKFQDLSNSALADADSDISRTQMWLQHEAITYWTGQCRKRKEIVDRCKEAVREKQNFKDSATKSKQSSVLEEKALRAAEARLETAEQRLNNVRRYTRLLEREAMMFKGSVQRFTTAVTLDIPGGVARLENHIRTLEAYVGLRATPSELTSSADENLSPMARGDAPPPTSLLAADLAASLRSRTPPLNVRLLSPHGNIPPFPAIKSLEMWEREILSRLIPAATSPDPADTLLISPGIATATKI